MTLTFTSGRSDMARVLAHLQAHDHAFQPPLSSRVSLADYARKLVDHALRLEAWAGDDLIGLVAVYCNAPEQDAAFVSNVSVLASHAGQGIARLLMQSAITQVRERGFSNLRLDVDHRATVALRLYLALGFQPADKAANGSVSMILPLGPRPPTALP
jgi:GNAT superfamily N-acetyltransferase